MLSSAIIERKRLSSYMNGATSTAKAEARVALREYLEYLQTKIDTVPLTSELRADLYVGLNGAGKTQLARQKRDVVRIDPDNAMWHFDSMKAIAEHFNGLSFASAILKDTSKHLMRAAKRNTDMAMNLLVERGLPFSFEMTGHSERAPVFIDHLLRARYNVYLSIADAPKYVRDKGLESHAQDTVQPVYVDPKANEEKAVGTGRNLHAMIDRACEVKIYWRDSKDEGLRLIALSPANGDRVRILDPKAVRAFEADSEIFKHSGFKSLREALDAHHTRRVVKLTNMDRIASQTYTELHPVHM